jgi:hypothetical protein
MARIKDDVAIVLIGASLLGRSGKALTQLRTRGSSSGSFWRSAGASLQTPAEGGEKISPNFTKLLKIRAKPGKAVKNSRKEQGRSAGAEQDKAGKSRRTGRRG